MNAKQRAAHAALDYVQSNSVIGLGSGSTAECFLHELAGALKSGRLANITGVPTSGKTAQLAGELGIPLTTLSRASRLAVTIDGADEVTPKLELIKGGGGALLREKIVAQNSAKVVIIADASKRAEKLGMIFAVPVEIARFEHECQPRFLRTLGCEPKLRKKSDGSEYLTDNEHVIYDCRFPGGIDDPKALETKLRARAGVMETGLFLGLASVALIADDNGVQTLR